MTLKKITQLTLACLFFNLISCSDESLQEPVVNKNNTIMQLEGEQSARIATIQSASTCSFSFNGNYSGSGYYKYPDRVISLCPQAGGTVTIYCNSIEVPNRFTVYDKARNFVASTDWIGYSSNSGPWGTSLNGPGTKTLTFSKGATDTYYLSVETVTQGITDAWEASVGCTNICPEPPVPSVSITPSASCGGTISGYYKYQPNGNYTYATSTLSLGSAVAGSTITLTLNPGTAPNKFTVLDANSAIVVSSSWLGVASYGGPWGSSLNNPGTKTISFVKGTSSTYYLKVETSVYNNNDDFTVSVACIAPPPSCVTSCGTNLNGSYGGSGYYTYPEKTLEFCTTPAGKTITISCNAYEVPNRFTIYDEYGNFVTGTQWIGYSTGPGPWGNFVLNGPGSFTLTFPKSTNKYRLKIETVTQGITDSWGVGIGCQN